jgi:hypothetical protein
MNKKLALFILGLGLALTQKAMASGQGFQITNAFINPQGKFTVGFPSDTNSYFILIRNSSARNITNAVAMALGTTGGGQLTDPATASGSGFFKVQKVPLDSPYSSAGDGIDDVYKLQHTNVFPNTLSPIYASLDSDGDGVSNLREYQRGTDPGNSASVNVNLYVNSATGSDANDGIAPTITPWAMGTHGPMLTIQGAISTSISGDTVVIASGIYHDTSLNPGSRSITLSPQGSVTLQ